MCFCQEPLKDYKMEKVYTSMGLLTKEQIMELIKERKMKTTEDISLMFKNLFWKPCNPNSIGCTAIIGLKE